MGRPGQDIPLRYTLWWDDHCEAPFRRHELFHWCGVFCNIACCAVLLGMYFQFNYGRTPWMWRIYAGSIVCFGLVPAAVFRWRSASWDSLNRKMENETEPSVRTPMAHRRSAQSVDALGLHEPLLAGDTNE